MTEISKEISIRRFCGSLVGRIYLWRSSETRERDEIAPPSALKPTPPGRLLVSRIINQGRFDWGPFSAFEDGSFEVERVGLTQWFRNFSELERSVKKAAISRNFELSVATLVHTGSKIIVEVLDGEILVTMPGTSFSVVYEKTKNNRLIASSFSGRKVRDERSRMSFPHFLSLAWTAANEKAKEIGWIVSGRAN